MIRDMRLGGTVREYITPPKDWGMRLPDEIRKCVAFIGYRAPDHEVVIGGTAFFVSVESATVKGRDYCYLVTAQHNLFKIGARPVVVRLNTKRGEFKDEDIGSDPKWVYHESDDDPEGPWVDMALLRWTPPEDEFEYLTIPDAMFARPVDFTDWDVWGQIEAIGPGDEVYITGLFSRLTGRRANLPIVRTGNLAMLPTDTEPVPVWRTDNEPRDMEAYLIEARSIGGLSGSPVFVRQTVHRGEGGLHLLGLIHGHWDAKPGTITDATQSETGEEGVSVNMGIAVVVPAAKVRETLYRDDLTRARAREDRQRDMANAPTPDRGG